MKLYRKLSARLFQKTILANDLPTADSDVLCTEMYIGMWSIHDGTVSLNSASQKLLQTCKSTLDVTEFVQLFARPDDIAHSLHEALNCRTGGLNCTVEQDNKTLRLFGKVFGNSSLNGCMVDITENVKHHEQKHKIDLLHIMHDQDHQRKNKLISLFRTVCHEIRNPLQGIISNLELIDASSFDRDAQIKKSVKDALNACFYQLEILNEMIHCENLESLENRTTLLEMKNINTMLQNIVSVFEGTCRTKGLKLVIVDEENAVEAKFSSKNVQQILVNFVNNAVKFSMRGTITIRCSYTEKNSVLISIIDEGIGIRPDTRSRLFSGGIFRDRPIDMDQFSSGMGLEICANIAKMIFAEIGFYDNVPQGSVFWIKFPIFECNNEPMYNRHPVAPMECKKQLKVLLCDDNRIINRAFATIIKQNHLITAAFSGEEALSLIKQESYDVVMCDLYMKDVSGMDVFRELRNKSKTVPFILVTGDISEKVRSSLILMNDSGDENLYIMLKPVVKKDLMELLTKLSNQTYTSS